MVTGKGPTMSMPTVSRESVAKVKVVKPEFMSLVVLRLEQAEQALIHRAMSSHMLGQ